MRKFVPAIASMLLLGAVPAQADVVSFAGSVTGSSFLVGPAPPDCAPLPFQTHIDPATTVGHSNLGDFHLSTLTCIALGGGTSFGTFTIDFYDAGDQFSGSFNGGSSPTSIPTISNVDWLFTITGGTGRFADASGIFEGTGTADATTRPTHVVIDFGPPVPEPASWTLMLLGFGGIGFAIRRRRRASFAQFA